MSIWSRSAAEENREQFWRTPPKDPTKAHRKSGTPYFRRGQGRILMPDDFMPAGEHAGKHLRAVPVDYLVWVDAQPWSRHWAPWIPVSDYISRFVTSDAETSGAIETPPASSILFMDELRKHPTRIKCFEAGSAHLHTLPGHEDLLHAFAVGGLGLSRDYYQLGRLPHYDLTVGKHAQALRLGVTLVPDRQLIDHKDTWVQFFASKRIQERP